MSRELPNRERWIGWVTFAWILAIITIISAVFLIAQLGQVEVPTVDRFGTTSWSTEANVMVWAMGIGQSVAALMLAALFSMINSIYQNSCDHISIAMEAKPQRLQSQPDQSHNRDDGDEVEDSTNYDTRGLHIDSVHSASPLHGHVKPGYKLLAVNGQVVDSELDAAKKVVEGLNEFTFHNESQNQIKRYIDMKPGPLHIRFS